jgi:hypothetical protein
MRPGQARAHEKSQSRTGNWQQICSEGVCIYLGPPPKQDGGPDSGLLAHGVTSSHTVHAVRFWSEKLPLTCVELGARYWD